MGQLSADWEDDPVKICYKIIEELEDLYDAIPGDEEIEKYEFDKKRLLNEADDNNCRMNPYTGKLIYTEYDLGLACDDLQENI